MSREPLAERNGLAGGMRVTAGVLETPPSPSPPGARNESRRLHHRGHRTGGARSCSFNIWNTIPMKHEVNAEFVRFLFDYEKSTGSLIWANPLLRSKKRRGDIAGSIKRDGYRCVCIQGRYYQAHRVIWLYLYGRWPRGQIDHINCRRDDNRIENLRECTRVQNNWNRMATGALKVKGVSAIRGKFQVICNESYVGIFKTIEEASAAYDRAAKKAYGEFAWLNLKESE